MRKPTILCAAAILASTVTFHSAAQAAGCALYDPNCQTYPMPSNDTSASPSTARADASYQRRHHYRADTPANVAGAAVGTAGDIAAGAVNTAGAIATAPFRPTDSYAYYNDGNNGWNQQQSYAERNGFVCTPGTYFKGFDGRRHPCQ
jgi:hypothetical protein